MKNHSQSSDIDDQARLILTARIVSLYCLIVFSVISAIVYYQAPISLENGRSGSPAILYFVWFLYYGLPFVLAVIFGCLFRPFRKSFRNILFAIFFMQLLYSFTVSMLRWEYLQDFNKARGWKKSDRIRIADLTPQQFDRNQDGFIEELKLNVVFDFTKIRPGEYLLDAAIVSDAAVSPFEINGGGLFTIDKTSADNMISREFDITVRADLESAVYVMQTFQVKLLLFRIISIDERGKNVLAFSRWSPFFRSTNWDGSDAEIYADWVLFDKQVLPNIFSLRAPLLKVN
ncbi:MAG: hypothetical protein H6753_05710 [Candidatus Omnitrophica bacterium]|nr:hypothetical protein [Candidatus Omnitrophota bacterium]